MSGESRLAEMAVARLSRLCPLALAPHFVNTQFCHRQDHLEHCVCTSQGTRLALGYLCSVSLCKLHPEKPLRLHRGCIVLLRLLELCPLGQSREERTQRVCQADVPARRE